jgi:hypothetical protein
MIESTHAGILAFVLIFFLTKAYAWFAKCFHVVTEAVIYLYLQANTIYGAIRGLEVWTECAGMTPVGTQNQGYPLLQYEGTVFMRLSLVARQTAPNPTTWMTPWPPRGQRRQSTLRCQRWVRTPTGSVGPLGRQTRPPGRVPDPSGGVRATHRRVLGFQGKE